MSSAWLVAGPGWAKERRTEVSRSVSHGPACMTEGCGEVHQGPLGSAETHVGDPLMVVAVRRVDAPGTPTPVRGSHPRHFRSAKDARSCHFVPSCTTSSTDET